MLWRPMSIGIAFLATVLGTTLAMAQSSPPPSSRAQETEAMVNKAAALIDAKGRAAFSEFRVKGTEWFMATPICTHTI
jgi:cytochrome c